MDAWAGSEMKVADLQEQLRDAQCGVETELHRIYPGWTSALTTTSANPASMVQGFTLQEQIAANTPLAAVAIVRELWSLPV